MGGWREAKIKVIAAVSLLMLIHTEVIEFKSVLYAKQKPFKNRSKTYI